MMRFALSQDYQSGTMLDAISLLDISLSSDFARSSAEYPEQRLSCSGKASLHAALLSKRRFTPRATLHMLVFRRRLEFDMY
jgi:hypothetical protein